MIQHFCYTEQNKVNYVTLGNMIENIKTFCYENNKLLGSNYLTFSENFKIDDLLVNTNYDNKCVIMKYDDKWELVEKTVQIMETGWFYSNKINKCEINVLQTYNIIQLNNKKYTNEIINIIEKNDFIKLLDHKIINNCLLMEKHYDILFSKCNNIAILIHFINVCSDLEHIDENNKKIFNYIIENPTNITLDIVKYIVDNNKINMEFENNNNEKYIHIIIEFYNKTYFYKNIFEDVLLFLIGSNIDLISVTNKGWNLLHYICAYGSENLIKTLIIKYKCTYNNCDTDIINGKTYDGNTPLHIICKYKYGINIIKFMIDNGADKTIFNNDKYLPFNYIPLGKNLL